MSSVNFAAAEVLWYRQSMSDFDFCEGLRRVAAAVTAAALTVTAAGAASGAERLATILVYHRFGEDHIPSTNTPLADFEAHLEHLASEGYSVISLDRLVTAMETGAALPERSVVITIDDAYRSTYEEAWPRLRARGFPFALFVATEPAGGRGYMSWDEVLEMDADPLVTIGHHSHSHGHMTNFSASERAADFERAAGIFEREIGYVPEFFAYPYGEYTLSWATALEEAGMRASLAQHSGSVGRETSAGVLPRFAMTGFHTSLDRLKLVLGTEPVLVKNFEPADPVLDVADNPPLVRFEVDELEGDLGGLACYLGGERAEVVVDGRTVDVRFGGVLPLGRNRLNCTLPRGGGVWGWLGVLLYYPGNDD
ncbi:MAG: polysaccharide deacetylase family protein [Alphaproteobacteria bacterium]|nr:polysaccharide deacetylase family protein [Alphaproteobacteria bacterium]